MITVVGEALIDLVGAPGGRTFTAHPGGSPANVAVGLSRLGNDVTLATRFGDDAFGRILRDHLADGAVDVRILPGQERATSLAIATLDPQGSAEYDFRIAWDAAEPPALDPACRAVHTGSLATALRPGADMVEAFLAAESARGAVTLSLDPNVRPSLVDSPKDARAGVERQAALVDVVKASTEDVAFLYPGVPVAEVARRWLALGPAVVVVTHGGEGAYAVTASGSAERDAIPVDVVDTVGAGDAFTAGLLDWLAREDLLGGDRRTRLRSLGGAGLRELLRAAVITSGLTCAHQGADPPTRAEVESVIQAELDVESVAAAEHLCASDPAAS